MFTKATTITSDWLWLRSDAANNAQNVKMLRAIRDTLNNQFPNDIHLVIRTHNFVNIYYASKEETNG